MKERKREKDTRRPTRQESATLSAQTRLERRQERNRKKVRRIIFGVLMICCVCVFCWTGYTASYVAPLLFGDLTGDNLDKIDEKTQEELMISGQMTVLLMGWDHRKNETIGRSDTLMVAFIDLDKKLVRLLSIPRDSLVEVPGHGKTKINHAFAYGGVDLTKQTLEQDFGIVPDYTAVVDFQAFRDLVDAIGGVTIEVPFHMYNPVEAIDLPAGMQTLNGKQALQFVRFRDDEGDAPRIQRQQEFMIVLKNQLMSAGTLASIPALCEAVEANVEMDMSGSTLLKVLVTLGTDMVMETYQPQGEYQYINGGWYFLIDEETKDAFFGALTNYEDVVPNNSNYAEEAMAEGATMGGTDGTNGTDGTEGTTN